MARPTDDAVSSTLSEGGASVDGALEGRLPALEQPSHSTLSLSSRWPGGSSL